MNKKNTGKHIFFLWGFVIFLNLLFSSGWDIWMQTLSFYLTLIILTLTFIYRPGLKLQYSGYLGLAILFSLISYFSVPRTGTSDIALISWITTILFFFIGAAYLTRLKEKTSLRIAVICIWAAILDTISPYLFGADIFPNPNIKAGFFILTIPFLIHILKEEVKKNSNKIFFWIPAAAITLYSFMRAQSRWGFIILCLSTVTWFLINKMKRSAAVTAGAGVLSGIIFLSFRSFFLSSVSRTGWIEGGFMMVLKKPFTGFGPGSTPHILPSFSGGELTMGLAERFNSFTVSEASRFSHHIHSYFIQLAAEFGLPAMIFLAFFLFFAVKKIIISKNKLDKTAGVALIFTAAYNLLEYNLSIPLLGFLFFSILGTYFPAEEREIKRSAHKSILLTALLIFIAAGGVFALRPFRHSRYFNTGMQNLFVSDTRKASKNFKKSLYLYPDSYLTRLGEASIEIERGNMIRAEELIIKSIPLFKGPNPAVQSLQEARQARQDGNLAEAEKKYRESIRIRFNQFGYNYPI